MALPRDDRPNISMSEMVPPSKKHCMRSEKDNKNCESNDNLQNGITQSPRYEDQENDVTQSPEEWEPDFSKLPKLVWTMIMSMMKERDRLALAVTCKTLYSYCMSESILWRSANMYVGNWGRRWSTCQVELNPTEISVLQAHSHQIRNMNIMIGNLHGLRFNERSFRILNEAVTNWSLKKLFITCHVDNVRICPEDPMVNNVGQLIRNCLTEKSEGLEELAIRKCFWTNGDESSVILEALKISPFSNSLKYLSLGPMRTTRKFDKRDTIPQVVNCVGRFQNLRTLFLWIPYLSNLLIETLSNSMTRQFKDLMFAGCFDSFQEGITKWPQLLRSCPDLRVLLNVHCRVNCEDTLASFPPIVPVEKVIIQYFTDTSIQDNRRELLQLLPSYSQTLSILAWHDRSKSNFDSVLIDTAKRCLKLFHLYFNGCINSSSISTLASIRNWQTLNFLDRSVIFPESNTETRDMQMSKLKTEVRKCLGHKCVKFALPVCVTNSEDLSLQNRPISFKFRCQPVQL